MGALFDGVDDLFNCGSAAGLDALTNLTYSAWIYANSTGESGVGAILFKSNTFSNHTGFRMDNTATLNFSVDYSTTDLARSASDNSCSLNAWHHVLCTWTGSATATNIKIYVDGVETTYKTTTNGVGTRNSDAAYNQCIGNRLAASLTFDGVITEAAIWNVVLTAAQIELLAKSRVKMMPLQIQPSALKAYWPLDESSDAGAVANAVDRSGNGNTGTATSFPATAGRAELNLSYP